MHCSHNRQQYILLCISDEINLLADKIPLDVGETPLKIKYKYCCLNLLHDMEQMKMPVPSLYLIKSCIFSIYIMLEENYMADIWAKELWKMSRWNIVELVNWKKKK